MFSSLPTLFCWCAQPHCALGVEWSRTAPACPCTAARVAWPCTSVPLGLRAQKTRIRNLTPPPRLQWMLYAASTACSVQGTLNRNSKSRLTHLASATRLPPAEAPPPRPSASTKRRSWQQPTSSDQARERKSSWAQAAPQQNKVVRSLALCVLP